MHSINVPVSRSVKFTHRSVSISNNNNDININPRDYLIVEADHDNSTLGLLIDI